MTPSPAVPPSRVRRRLPGRLRGRPPCLSCGRRPSPSASCGRATPRRGSRCSQRKKFRDSSRRRPPPSRDSNASSSGLSVSGAKASTSASPSVPADTDAPAGLFQIRRRDVDFRTAEWGFAIGSAFWKTGLFPEGAQLVIQFAFERLRTHGAPRSAVGRQERTRERRAPETGRGARSDASPVVRQEWRAAGPEPLEDQPRRRIGWQGRPDPAPSLNRWHARSRAPHSAIGLGGRRTSR